MREPANAIEWRFIRQRAVDVDQFVGEEESAREDINSGLGDQRGSGKHSCRWSIVDGSRTANTRVD